MVKSVPEVPIPNVCIEFVSPFKEVMALPLNKLAIVLVVTSPGILVVKISVFVVFVPNASNLKVPNVLSFAAGGPANPMAKLEVVGIMMFPFSLI
jgi:hypothetical protein